MDEMKEPAEGRKRDDSTLRHLIGQSSLRIRIRGESPMSIGAQGAAAQFGGLVGELKAEGRDLLREALIQRGIGNPDSGPFEY
jgi:hypothetical protein